MRDEGDELIILQVLLSHFSRVWLCVTPETAAHQAPRPWDSPGKNTGVGCHFPLQCMKVKRESEDAQSCPTLSDPMDRSLPGSSIHGIFQARVLEWGAIAFSDWLLLGVGIFWWQTSTSQVSRQTRSLQSAPTVDDAVTTADVVLDANVDRFLGAS